MSQKQDVPHFQDMSGITRFSVLNPGLGRAESKVFWKFLIRTLNFQQFSKNTVDDNQKSGKLTSWGW